MTYMDQNPTSTPSFEAYIHNPWMQPTILHKAAITAAQRKQRYVEGYDAVQDGRDAIREVFDLDIILKTGMRDAYAKLVRNIHENPYGIGTIIAVAYHPSTSSFGTYTSQDGTQIDLYEHVIARNVIVEYLSKEDVIQLINDIPCAKAIEKQIRDMLRANKK